MPTSEHPATVSTVPAGSAEPAYPAHREADVVLSDGGTVHLRPIRPSDADGVVAVHSRFSDRTRYLRYFAPYPRIPARDLERFTRVDHVGREAFVVTLGDDIIAIGRYEQLSPDAAEVAFVVEDAHQGRGIASVLLEHLAAAARENHIVRFVAEVLPQNSAMVRVFTDAGYVVDRSFEEGVVHIVFDTAETPQLLSVLQDREQRTEARSLRRLLEPGTVAVVGVGRETGGMGRVVFDNLRGAGFAGRVVPVNPHTDSIDGVPCAPSVEAIEGVVDLVVIAVPAAGVPAVVADCAAKGVSGLIIVSGGFAERPALPGETGTPGGVLAQRRLVQVARANGMRVVGPNCFGVLNTDPAVALNATLAAGLPARGRVGFFCQSGALGIALLAEVDRRGLGLSSFVSAGNRGDVSGNDLLQYWRADPATDVVLMYLETFGNPRKFARVARELARHKPVVVLKSRAAPPALAGSVGSGPGQYGLQALYQASGVIRVDAIGQLFDVAQLLAYQPLPAGDRVAVIGNSAALVALSADACAANGLTVTPEWTVDVGPDPTPAELRTALRAAVAAADVDQVLVVFVPALAVPESDYAAVVREESGEEHARVPVVASFLAANGMPEALRRPGADGSAAPARGSVPSYATPEAAAWTLGTVAGYARWRRTPAGVPPADLRTEPDRARSLLSRIAAEHPAGVVLEDGELAGILAAYGIGLWPTRSARGADALAGVAAELGYPVVVKAAEEGLRHRVDLGAVQLDVRTPDEARTAYATIATAAGTDDPRVLVQPMARAGVACVIEVVQDAAFGPIVGFGLGGVATELIGDRGWRAAPLTDSDAAGLLREPRAAPLLFGYRGAPPVDAAACEDLLLRVGALAADQPELASVALNPVLAGPDGVIVLHASARVARPRPHPDAGPRRLR